MKNIYYSPERVISYNALLNLIIGERGVGKTYSFKTYAVKRFLKKHKQFVYLRRYESDLDASVGSSSDNKFFEQIGREFPEAEFKITKAKKVRKLYINNQICGYALPLSSADSLKSSTYENVDMIIYDEFMLKEGTTQRYLKNEPEIILDLIETIGRLRNINIYCLANAISTTCPLMSYFNLTLPYNSDIKTFKDGLILVNYIKNEEYRKVKKESRFGKLIADTHYGEYAIDNKFLTDNKCFIKKKDNKAKFYFILSLGDRDYGVWRDYSTYSMFISNDVDPNCPMIFTINNEFHNENTIFAKVRSNPYFKNLIEFYRVGHLFFESQQIKNLVMQELSKYII